jgi:aspartate aminotransferase
MLAGYAERRAALISGLSDLGDVEFPAPEGAFYVFARFAGGGRSSTAMTADFRRAGVLVRAGSEFGPSAEE